MRMATCKCGLGGTVTVQGAGLHSRTFGQGSRVDLDHVINDQGQTMGEALERYLHLFDVDEPEVKRLVFGFRDIVHERATIEE